MTFIPSSGAAGAGAKAAGFGTFSPYILAGSTLLGGLSKRKAARENAKRQREIAIASMVRGYFTERSMRREQEDLFSTIRARAAAGGLDVSRGSPLEAYMQAVRESELEVLHARNTARAETAAAFRSARDAERGGDQALLGAGLSGAGEFAAYQTRKRRLSYGGY